MSDIERCAGCGEPVSFTDEGGCVGSDPAYHFKAECLLEAARRANAQLEGAVNRGHALYEAMREITHVGFRSREDMWAFAQGAIDAYVANGGQAMSAIERWSPDDQAEALRVIRTLADPDADPAYREAVRRRAWTWARDQAPPTQGAVTALRDLIGNATCYCDHPLRRNDSTPCSKCRAVAFLTTAGGQ